MEIESAETGVNPVGSSDLVRFVLAVSGLVNQGVIQGPHNLLLPTQWSAQLKKGWCNMEDQRNELVTTAYTLEESTKALVDKMASGGQFPETLLQSVSLLEQIEQANSVISTLRDSVSKEDYTEIVNELSKYKEAYRKVKAARDDLAHHKADLENRISDLEKKVQKTDQLLSDLKQREAEVIALKKQVSTRVVSFESLYQDLKTLCESRTTLFSVPVGKTIEICIRTDQQQPKLAYFLLDRQSENQFTVKRAQFH